MFVRHWSQSNCVIEYNHMVIEYNRITIGSWINGINQEENVKIRLPFDCQN